MNNVGLLKEFLQVSSNLKEKYIQYLESIEWADIDVNKVKDEIISLENKHLELLSKLLSIKKESNNSKKVLEKMTQAYNILTELQDNSKSDDIKDNKIDSLFDTYLDIANYLKEYVQELKL